MAERWEVVRSAPRYRVSTLGRVCTAKGRKYCVVPLVLEDGKRRSVGVHRLVAEAFIPNPDGLLTVHHIDADPSNNKVENLMWASAQTQALARAPYKISGRPVYQLDLDMKVVKRWPIMKAVLAAYNIPSSRLSQICRRYAHRPWKGFFWRYADDIDMNPNEEWRQVPGQREGVMASSLGRIKNSRSDGNWGRILNPADCCGNYRSVVLDGKHFTVHRLVAAAFLPNPNNLPVVNHLDGDKGNNIVANLEWTTFQGNSQHAHDNALVKSIGNGFLIKSIAIDGIEKLYPSQNHAAVAMGAERCCSGSIRRAMQTRTPWKGHMWECVTADVSCLEGM